MERNETKEQLQKELEAIHIWENEQKGLWIWEKLGRLPFKILDRLTPQFIHNKIGQALDELGSYLQTGGRYLSNEKDVLKRYNRKTGAEDATLGSISALPIQMMDEVSDELIRSRKNIAMTQGATTGIGGIFTLSIDIPLLLGISLKTLQEIAVAYGYDPNDKKERIFIVKCLQFASSDIVGKQAILKELSAYSDPDVETRDETLSQVQGWREVIMTYRDNFGWKKLFQMIPIAGIIFGSFINKSMIHDIGETGKMLYKKRRVKEKLEALALGS
ncbi:EcsC family protein [Robertmurraya kyonggiensis]|uniref:EcsC family protein n=1 Tax=Robertmurraya kyonggiensis TaxID=1037680 RepID=A0A4U1CXB9_9BACI|nr:EcsC family protein [Robertmurraya kyonggiensis]TKC14729.1 EcsC family protein [Robertmurraya kyonggiensis]